MRLLPAASFALLGVKVAMGSFIELPRQTDHAQPTRPRTALGVQETGRVGQEEPGTAATAATLELQAQEDRLEQQRQQRQQQQEAELQLQTQRPDLRRRQDSMSASSSSSSRSSATNGIASVISQSGAIYETSTTAQAGPITTELAYFTAGGGVYSVSSLANGANVVAGKTLTIGGADALVGGAEVTAATNGLLVNGVEAEFETVTRSASVSGSMSSAMAGTSSGAVGSGSGSGSVAVASQSSSPDAAMAGATAGVGVAVGAVAVVGALIMW